MTARAAAPAPGAAQLAQALEAAAVVVTLHGAAYAPIFERLERELAAARAAEAGATALEARAAQLAARALAGGGRDNAKRYFSIARQ